MSGSGMDAYFAAMAPVMGEILGAEAVELRRPMTLRGPDLKAALSLVASTPASVGATSLSVALAGGGVMRGAVPAGLVVSVPGGSVAVLEAANITQPATVVVLHVGALPAAVAAGDVVSLADYAGWTLSHCTVHMSQDSLVDRQELSPAPSFVVSAPRATAPVAPIVGDVVSCSLGRGVVFAAPNDGGGSYECLVGRQAGSSIPGWGV